MNFDLADLRAFVAVADTGSFGQAASALNLSQPALSRRIAKLESALNVQLFQRTTRTVQLTPVGRNFLDSARHILNEVEISVLGSRDLSASLSGEINIACVPSAVAYLLPEAIDAYQQRYPRMRLRIADESASEILVAVMRGQADFGLTYLNAPEPDLEFEPVFEEPFVAACPRNHPLAAKESVTWAELVEHRYMTIAKGSVNRALLDMALVQAGLQPNWHCEVRHVPALVSLVAAGLGVGVVPRLAMPIDAHPLLVSIPLVEPALSRTVGLVRRHGRPLTPAAQRFYEILLESLKDNPTLLSLMPRKT
jgi:DNA-binding transcriptional LysR family regulator